MDVNELRQCFIAGTITERLETLSYLSDVFESYNKNITNFDEIMNLLIDNSITEDNLEVKCEFFEVLVKATVFQEVHQINFDKLEHSLVELPVECLSRCIDVLSFSHNKKYIPSLEVYRNHDDKNVRESVELAIKEIMGYHKKLTE